VIEGLL